MHGDGGAGLGTRPPPPPLDALVADQHDRMVVPCRVGDGERDDLGKLSPAGTVRSIRCDENGRGRAATRSGEASG